jgi:hypothetical protein
MKKWTSIVSLSALLLAFCVGAFAYQDGTATESLQSRTAIVPLNDAEKATMMYIREEEKLARDVYIRMYEIWGATIFSNISVSEQRHMDAVLRLLIKYRIPDPAAGQPIGVFTNQELQELYASLVSRGQMSVLDAYWVGKIIEEKDILDLQDAINETHKADLDQVYGNLLKGSYNHLRAFNSHI